MPAGGLALALGVLPRPIGETAHREAVGEVNLMPVQQEHPAVAAARQRNEDGIALAAAGPVQVHTTQYPDTFGNFVIASEAVTADLRRFAQTTTITAAQLTSYYTAFTSYVTSAATTNNVTLFGNILTTGVTTGANTYQYRGIPDWGNIGTSWATVWPVQTPEQQAAAARRARAAERKRKIAAKRAIVLLKTHLEDDEHDQLQRLGYFEVESLTSGRRYRIYGNTYSRNVVELDAAGVPINRLCAHGGYGSKMPLQDHLLAQKLYLQACEDEFRKIANHSRIGKVEAAQLMGLPDPTVAKYQQILEAAA